MITLRTLIATFLVLTTTAACGNAGPNSGPVPNAAANVVISNNNWNDMTVYAVQSGQRARLGTVTSMTTRTISLPQSMVSGGAEVALVADPIGSSQAYRTRTVQLQPGQTIEFTIENHMAISSVSIR